MSAQPVLFLYVQVVLTRFFRFSTIQLRPGPSVFSYFSYNHLCIFAIYFNKSLYSFLFKSWNWSVWQQLVVKYTNLSLQLLFGLSVSCYYLPQHFRSRHPGCPLVHSGARTLIAILTFCWPCISVLFSVFNQLDAKILFHSKFYFIPLHVSSTCATGVMIPEAV